MRGRFDLMRIVTVKRIFIALWIIITALLVIFLIGHHSVDHDNEPMILYSLDKRANDQAIIDIIDAAQKYIYFAVYTFTKNDIADALINAKKKGIDVQGITDTEQAKSDYEKPIVQKLKAAGIQIETQQHDDGLMHIKAVVTDKEYAMGSYNWTESATVANDELLEIGTDDRVSAAYADIIKRILAVNRVIGVSDIQSTERNVSMNEKNGKIYPYNDALDHIGETATVEGIPIDIHASTGGTIFFDYCKNYKNCPFSAVIFASDIRKFKNIMQYQGETIDVAGSIKNYGGRAEIVINDPGQVHLVGNVD